MLKKFDTMRFIAGRFTSISLEIEFLPSFFLYPVFLFCGGCKDSSKSLYWDDQGFWILYKCFENSKLT